MHSLTLYPESPVTMDPELDKVFGRLLESHRDAPAAMTSITDPSFAVLACGLDQAMASSMLGMLETGPQHKAKNLVGRGLASAVKNFLAAERHAPVARRAVVTASLSLFRLSCAVSVPSKLSGMAAHAVLRALGAASAATITAGSGKKHERHDHQSSSAMATGVGRGLVLGTEDFPESQLAAFLLDATRVEPPPPPTPPIAVPAEVAVKIISVFGVGKSRGRSKDHWLEWGSPSVADSLRGSVRRVVNRLQRERNWDLISELMEHMETPNGAGECEGVLGITLGELIAAAMLEEMWEPARRLVSTAAAGLPRQTLARALIPAAADAKAFETATCLIKDNDLVSEFPNYQTLLKQAWMQQKKRRLEAVVVKPGWKMAQQMLARGSRHEHELRLWLVKHMVGLGNLPAAAALMDQFGLHGELPSLDPALVEASARERAAAHLQLPISTTRVVVVDGSRTLQYAQYALMEPASVGAKDGLPGVRCVGLDVENSPTTSRAMLLQVATSTDVFLFDLIALSERRADSAVFRRFDSTLEALLSNPSIVKLGFSFRDDAAALRRSCPHVRGFLRIEALLEVGELSSDVLGRDTPSLSKTCEAWLGKPLDKTECASMWESRPLTVDQVKYAALDAHCLVGIFEEMLLEKGGRLAAATGAANGRKSGGGGGGSPHSWWADRLVSISAEPSHHNNG